ncbi:MAG: patatin-like phospholipase family protein [Acidobacteriota bacterium]
MRDVITFPEQGAMPVSYDQVPVKEPSAPQFALVLGGGGVRSIVALGLFEVLQQEGLQPDLIVGCSAGAMFGALMASGHSAHEAVSLAARLWSPDVTRRRRLRAISQMLMPKLCGFNEEFGLRDDALVMQRLNQAFGATRIEELPTALRVVATDTATGDCVSLSRGSLVQALRASIAMPFLFSPVTIDGRRLMDGFASNPLPLSVAADAAAVVALGFDAPMPRRVDGPSRLLGRVTSAMTNNLMHANLNAARASGMNLISIIPTMEQRVGLFDTEAMPYLVELGRRVAMEHLNLIRSHLEAAYGADERPHRMFAFHPCAPVRGFQTVGQR